MSNKFALSYILILGCAYGHVALASWSDSPQIGPSAHEISSPSVDWSLAQSPDSPCGGVDESRRGGGQILAGTTEVTESAARNELRFPPVAVQVIGGTQTV